MTTNLKEVKNKISVKTESVFDPKEFYKNRAGLWVSSSFESRVLTNAETTKADTTAILASRDLINSVNDAEIEGELGSNHLFTATEVCAIVSDLIEKQPEGSEGVLVNNGYANLFYTEACVVSVSWYAVHGEWLVYAWDRGGDGWGDGRRVFSPVTDL